MRIEQNGLIQLEKLCFFDILAIIVALVGLICGDFLRLWKLETKGELVVYLHDE